MLAAIQDIFGVIQGRRKATTAHTSLLIRMPPGAQRDAAPMAAEVATTCTSFRFIRKKQMGAEVSPNAWPRGGLPRARSRAPKRSAYSMCRPATALALA